MYVIYYTFLLLILDLLIVEYVIGENERAIVGEVVELANLVVRVGFDPIDFGEFDIALIAVEFRRCFLSRAEHFALNAVFVVLAWQWTCL